MGFNRRKMEDQRRRAAEKEAAAKRATDAQLLEDAERLIAAWNERQAKRMPMLFSPTIGAAWSIVLAYLYRSPDISRSIPHLLSRVTSGTIIECCTSRRI